MNYLVWAIGFWMVQPLFLYQQSTNNDPLNYEKFEMEDVSSFRDHFEFTRPILKTNNNATSVVVDVDENLLPSFSQGNVVYIDADRRLSTFISKHKQINRTTNKMDGWKIIISAGSRTEANNIRNEIEIRYPNQNPESYYQVPNFSVILGNFLTKEDANRLAEKIISDYPMESVLPFPAKIIVPKYEIEEN